MKVTAVFTCLSLMTVVTVESSERPNIVLILTDDQDVMLGGAEHMDKTRELLEGAGVKFSNAYVTTPICCPSRASILTGRYLHNTHVINNTLEGGCSSKDWRQGLEKKTFAAHLKRAGYVTMYAGKYLNQYGTKGGGGISHVPSGWDFWAGLEGNSRYYNYSLSINGKRRRHGTSYEKDYLTDVIRNQSLQFLDHYSDLIKDQGKDEEDGDAPFLMVLAPPASHAPFTPAPQYRKHFQGEKAPRTEAFNRFEATDQKKHWLIESEPRQISKKGVEEIDEIYRNRLRTLLSVDDLVSAVHTSLSKNSLLNNTVFLYTSDHGYHLGQFGMPIDKRLPYEFDIKVPFWMSGPNIVQNQTIPTPILSIDIAPTILDLAGLPPSSSMDGVSFLPLVTISQPNRDTFSEATNTIIDNSVEQNLNISSDFIGIKARNSFLVEYSGEGARKSNSPSCNATLSGDFQNLSECDERFDCKCQDSRNNTYTCIRNIGQEDSLFCQFEDRGKFLEMYSLYQDPHQLHNLASELQNITLTHYLEHLLLLKNCRGYKCTVN